MGIIPNFRSDLEFDIGLNVAALTTLPSQPPPTSSLPNQSASAEAEGEAVVVSILSRNDRLRALEACLDEDSLFEVRADG